MLTRPDGPALYGTAVAALRPYFFLMFGVTVYPRQATVDSSVLDDCFNSKRQRLLSYPALVVLHAIGCTDSGIVWQTSILRRCEVPRVLIEPAETTEGTYLEIDTRNVSILSFFLPITKLAI